MANLGDTKEGEDGKGDIPTAVIKDNQTENGNSTSDSTESSDESSEEEEEEEEQEHEEDQSEDGESHEKALSQESNAEPSQETKNGEHARHVCERCEGLPRPSHQVVTPRRISKDRFLLMLEDEGVYECSETSLVFEVSQKVRIRYRILSWSRFGTYLSESWNVAGPIFDVDCDPSILKSIQFPHAICLADQDNEVKFSVLHVKNDRGLIEASSDFSRNHIRWSVSSLSPVGPIVRTVEPTKHHGVVLIYKELGLRDSYSFRVSLTTNNQSEIKDIQKEVRNSRKKYLKIEKPPACQKLLEEGRKYSLVSDPQGDITPESVQFSLAVVKIKGYIEAFFEQGPPFKFSLIEDDSGQTVWSATIREEDCVENTVEKSHKRTDSRKRSTSTSEEELCNKRRCYGDESDGPRAPGKTDMSDKQLMQVAKRLGKEWKAVAIGYLDLTKQDLDEIEGLETDALMMKFQMLERWRRRQPKGQAGVTHLYQLLDQDDVPIEVISVLKEMMPEKFI